MIKNINWLYYHSIFLVSLLYPVRPSTSLCGTTTNNERQKDMWSHLGTSYTSSAPRCFRNDTILYPSSWDNLEYVSTNPTKTKRRFIPHLAAAWRSNKHSEKAPGTKQESTSNFDSCCSCLFAFDVPNKRYSPCGGIYKKYPRKLRLPSFSLRYKRIASYHK